jgi:hypothetical protein
VSNAVETQCNINVGEMRNLSGINKVYCHAAEKVFRADFDAIGDYFLSKHDQKQA